MDSLKSGIQFLTTWTGDEENTDAPREVRGATRSRYGVLIPPQPHHIPLGEMLFTIPLRNYKGDISEDLRGCKGNIFVITNKG